MDSDKWDRGMTANALIAEAEELWSRRQEGRFLETKALTLLGKAGALGVVDIHFRIAALYRYDDELLAIQWLLEGARSMELACLLELARALSGGGPWSAAITDLDGSRVYWRLWFNENMSSPNGGFAMLPHLAEYTHVLHHGTVDQSDIKTLAAIQDYYKHQDSSQLLAVSSLIASVLEAHGL